MLVSAVLVVVGADALDVLKVVCVEDDGGGGVEAGFGAAFCNDQGSDMVSLVHAEFDYEPT